MCRVHGGSAPQVKRKSELVKAERAMLGMRRYTTPISHEDWEANPINSFDMEFRRTIAHIRYYEEKITELAEEDFVWGRTKSEDKFNNDGDAVGKGETEEAKPHVYEELLFRERRHLLDLQKTAFAVGLANKRLEATRALMDALEVALVNIISALGRDPKDPEVRNTVRLELARVAQPREESARVIEG